MTIKTEPSEIWQEYQQGVNYKTAIDLYENTRVNENFYIGKQWEGLNAPDLPKPTLNFLKRVVSYCIAMIVSDDVAVSFAPMAGDSRMDATAKIIAAEVEKVIEQVDAASMHRSVVRNAAVNGDGMVYLWFDADAETGQDAKGAIKIENIESINFHPGNPYIKSVQQQPYIIISLRKIAGEIREEAKENGMSEEDINNIEPDSDSQQGESGDSSQLGTELIKLWRDKETGTIKAKKVTEKANVKKEWDTGLKLYPVASMRWEEVRSQFFGNAMLNGLIQNQISVNRLFAMTIRSVEMNAFPKVVYDGTKIEKWTNRVGEAIKSNGPVDQQIMMPVRGGDVSSQVMQIIESVITLTRDFMGASDAALGNVKPDNTSAIIATQQATAMPLTLQQREFYRFVEEYVRIIVDMIRANYGKREIIVRDKALFSALVPSELLKLAPNAEAYPVQVDFSMLDSANMNLRVDVGAAAYWNELMQTQSMDNLVKSGIVTDMEVYIESIPDKMLRNKNKILESIREQKALAQQQAAMQAQLQQGAPPQGGVSNMLRQP